MKEEKKLTGDPRIDAKWFSRRHETSEANSVAHQAREARQTTKLQGVQDRAEAAAKRTPQEQLCRLDERLGVGMGATKERARLQARISTVGKKA